MELIDEFKIKYIKMWWDTSAELPRLDKSFNPIQQIAKERDMDIFINRAFSEMRSFPINNNSNCSVWGTVVKNLIRAAGSGILELTDSCMKILLDGGFFNVTSDFINKAHAFDSSIKMEDILQAMRNVWIMNSIQILMGLDVKPTASLFAYSMLYPYTDNYLDAPNIPLDEKKEIGVRFRRRLEGKTIEARNSYEGDLFKLAGIIEEQYPRDAYQQVFESLLGIHDAQQKSLLQQTGKISPYETDLVGISFEKGGTSVMTDAFLVNGNLTKEEACFMFGFGIFLQLADDMQDAATDMKNGHMTMFSQTAGKWPLDNIANRLFNFIINIMDNDNCFITPVKKELKNAIKINCTYLLLGAIANNRSMYSRSYIEKMEKYSPFRFQYMQQLYRRVGREYKSMRKKGPGIPSDMAIAQALAQSW